MTQKTRNIIGWTLSILLTLAFLASASFKLIGGEEMAKNAPAMGLSLDSLRYIAVIEILSALLFLIPRTGVLGTLLLAAYLGGAIVTHIEHGQPFTSPVVLQCLVWITAVIRFPELTSRISASNRSL
jgi:hypothetical protein